MIKQLIIFAFILFQGISFAQVDTLFLNKKIDKIEFDIKRLNQEIFDLKGETEKKIEINSRFIDSILNKVNLLKSDNDRLFTENKSLKGEIDKEKEKNNINNEDIKSKFRISAYSGVIVLVLFSIILIISIYLLIKYIKKSKLTLEEKTLQVDKELIEVLTKQMAILREVENSKEKIKSETEIDHSFALHVADEINRISMRIDKMDKNSRDVSAVVNALKRMEDNLNEQGYEIIDLKGKKYDDTYTALPINYVPVEGLKRGEQIINRIIKPQILYNGKAIQHGEIEVGCNEEDLG